MWTVYKIMSSQMKRYDLYLAHTYMQIVPRKPRRRRKTMNEEQGSKRSSIKFTMTDISSLPFPVTALPVMQQVIQGAWHYSIVQRRDRRLILRALPRTFEQTVESKMLRDDLRVSQPTVVLRVFDHFTRSSNEATCWIPRTPGCHRYW